jgi:hypothetical protein
MEHDIKAKDLVQDIKAIILSAQLKGCSWDQTLEAIGIFCDMMEEGGVPPQTIAAAFIETMIWVEGRLETLRSQHVTV